MVLENWRNAGLIEVDITEVNEWINQQGANLSDEEQAAFQQLLSVFIVMALDFNTAAQGVSRDPDQRGVFYAASQPSKV